MANLTFTNALTNFGLDSGANSTYATAHAGPSVSLNNFNDTAGVGIRNTFNTNYTFDRYWFHFDTSSLPDNATVTSAFLRLPGTATTNNNADTDTIGIYQSTVVSDTLLAITDWTNWGATLLGSLAFGSYNNAGNNDIALNASGIALVSLSGYTKLMVMTTKDHAATPPTGLNNETFSSTGLLLSVTYTTPTSGGAFFPNFI